MMGGGRVTAVPSAIFTSCSTTIHFLFNNTAEERGGHGVVSVFDMRSHPKEQQRRRPVVVVVVVEVVLLRWRWRLSCPPDSLPRADNAGRITDTSEEDGSHTPGLFSNYCTAFLHGQHKRDVMSAEEVHSVVVATVAAAVKDVRAEECERRTCWICSHHAFPSLKQWFIE
ncbi:unnamed protein product [Boreogadus saida]